MSAADNSAHVEQALALLQSLEPVADNQPATVVFPPGTQSFIIGNERGFVSLAIAALKAAQGEPQLFETASWIRSADLDWTTKGLKLDSLAHLDREEFDPGPSLLQRTLGAAVALLLILCFLVGLITLARWTIHLLIR